MIFKDKTPNIEEWKRRRENYLVKIDMPDPDVEPAEEKLPTEKMWFHDMRISVFKRKPFGVKDE